MLQVAQAANVAVRFALELGALASLSYWGFSVTPAAWPRAVLALVVPVVAAVIWSLLAAPHAGVVLPGPAKVAVQVGVLGSAAAALAHAGRSQLGAAFAAAVLVNAVLLLVWEQ